MIPRRKFPLALGNVRNKTQKTLDEIDVCCNF